MVNWVDRALARSLAQHGCFHCGGALLVWHLCPCCLQLVHPGCECAVSEQQAVCVEASAVDETVIGALEQEEGMRWQ